MKINIKHYVHEDSINFLNSIDFDLVIFGCGYEKRSSFVAREAKINFENDLILGFSADKNLFSRKENEQFFKKNFTNYIELSGDESSTIEKQLMDIEFEDGVINVLIDYTSMTRIWYSSLIRFFLNPNNLEDKKVNIFFSYSSGQFSNPSKSKDSVGYMSPIEGFVNLSIPDKPTALIIGLGYEKNIALGLKEYFDASEVYLFYSDGGIDPKYPKLVEANNTYMFNEVKTNNIFQYPINDLNFTQLLLNNVCESLNNDFRVIIAPSGPKPFNLISFFVALKIGSIDVWRISSYKKSFPTDKLPIGSLKLSHLTIIH